MFLCFSSLALRVSRVLFHIRSLPCVSYRISHVMFACSCWLSNLLLIARLHRFSDDFPGVVITVMYSLAIIIIFLIMGGFDVDATIGLLFFRHIVANVCCYPRCGYNYCFRGCYCCHFCQNCCFSYLIALFCSFLFVFLTQCWFLIVVVSCKLQRFPHLWLLFLFLVL